MIIWINGAFGAGKTTLAQQLHQRIPEALEFDPEYVGYLLRKWVPMPSSGDFQDIRLWRTLVADFAIGMAQEFQRPLIVPMTLIHPGYRRDVFERIQEADVRLLHVFLELPAEELRRRIQAQVLDADDAAADAAARAFRLAHVERGVATPTCRRAPWCCAPITTPQSSWPNWSWFAPARWSAAGPSPEASQRSDKPARGHADGPSRASGWSCPRLAGSDTRSGDSSVSTLFEPRDRSNFVLRRRFGNVQSVLFRTGTAAVMGGRQADPGAGQLFGPVRRPADAELASRPPAGQGRRRATTAVVVTPSCMTSARCSSSAARRACAFPPARSSWSASGAKTLPRWPSTQSVSTS